MVNNSKLRAFKTWGIQELYTRYAEYVLANNPQCWGKYSNAVKMKNYWIYTTVKNKVVEVINYKRWKAIIHAYFEAAKKYIIQGECFNLGDHLGSIKARCCQRDHRNKMINWEQTMKGPMRRDSEGNLLLNERGNPMPEKLVYHIDDHYVRIAWRKTRFITNEGMYEFIPTKGDGKRTGFRDAFSQANLQDPALKNQYDYYPFIRKEAS